MSVADERRRFERRHAAESVRVTVLTGEVAGGASRFGRTLWEASARVLAYVDERGTIVEGRGSVSWLVADDERGTEPGGTWIHDLQPLTQYVLRVRRALPNSDGDAARGVTVPDRSHQFALDAVLERDVHLPVLDERLARRSAALEAATELGVFEVDRSFDTFEGTVDWRGRSLGVSLDVDDDAVEGRETCVSALERLRAYVAEVERTDETWRTFAASQEPVLGHLRDDARSAGLDEPTIESLARGFRLSELGIGSDGSATAYYVDDGLFRDVAICVEIGPDGTPTDAYESG